MLGGVRVQPMSNIRLVRELRSLNPNVQYALLFTVFQSFGRGVWMGNVLSAYIFLLAGESNQMLGIVSAVTGLAMTVVVLPAGYLADRFRRDWMLRTAAIFGVFSLLFIFLSVNILTVAVGLALWGLFQGFTRPSLEAIFADSIESGRRSRLYAWKHVAQQIGLATGPFMNVALFYIYGDLWDLVILKSVMMVGLLLSFISIIILFLFKDEYELGKESESIIIAERKKESVSPQATLQKRSLKDKNKKTTLKYWSIPLILVSSNLIIGFGAGMTVKFFPIFFWKIYGMQPIIVQVILGLTFAFTGVSGLTAQKLSLRRGRAEMIFIVQAVATLCLLIIAFYPPAWILIPIFIARGALMNASQPLSRAILMDVIPKRHRGKLNSIEAIAWSLFWNVSAIIGGFLIGDNNNFRLCFLVTSGLYMLGTALILPLIPLVSKEKDQIEYEQKHLTTKAVSDIVLTDLPLKRR